jgi:hypothetical protein
MPAPHEIIAAPLTIYLAEIGTAAPAIDDVPDAFDAAWLVLGSEGDMNYGEDGVTMSHNESISDFVPAGSTMPSKRFRIGEDFLLSLNLVDLGPEAYARVMNDAEITTTGNSKKFSLYRGDQVKGFAILGRGMSTVDNELYLQYFFSKAFVSVDGNVVFNKGKPAELPVKIQAIRHSDSDEISVEIGTV